MMNTNVDLHIHTICSDGSDDVPTLISLLHDAGIRTFSITDHDTVFGVGEALEMTPPDMRFIPGVEFSCRTEKKNCHILGYGFAPDSEEIRAMVRKVSEMRRAKLELRISYLMNDRGIDLTKEEIADLRGRKSAGKPHLAKLIIKRGLAPDIATAIREYLDPCPRAVIRIAADEAIAAILAAGGIPVWAHPLGGETDRRLTETEFDDQLDLLRSFGIRGLECHYSRYTAENTAFLLGRAERFGLLVSGGSDYHGANKTVKLGQLNVEETPVIDSSLSLLSAL